MGDPIEDNVELSLVIPTYNEKENIPPLISQLFKTGLNLEVIVVDDNSPDQTWQVAEELSTKYNVKVIRRMGKASLSSAVIDGFSAARGAIIGVMDGDLQHPTSLLPKLFDAAKNGADISIASRYTSRGGLSRFNRMRLAISQTARLIAMPLTKVKDPISGYFLLKRKVVDGIKMNPIGYKILLEILVKGNYNTVKEVPFSIQNRRGGESKLGYRVMLEYLIHVGKLLSYKYSNPRARNSTYTLL